MFCSKCGASVSGEENFCSKCGNPTSKANEVLETTPLQATADVVVPASEAIPVETSVAVESPVATLPAEEIPAAPVTEAFAAADETDVTQPNALSVAAEKTKGFFSKFSKKQIWLGVAAILVIIIACASVYRALNNPEKVLDSYLKSIEEANYEKLYIAPDKKITSEEFVPKSAFSKHLELGVGEKKLVSYEIMEKTYDSRDSSKKESDEFEKTMQEYADLYGVSLEEIMNDYYKDMEEQDRTVTYRVSLEYSDKTKEKSSLSLTKTDGRWVVTNGLYGYDCDYTLNTEINIPNDVKVSINGVAVADKYLDSKGNSTSTYTIPALFYGYNEITYEYEGFEPVTGSLSASSYYAHASFASKELVIKDDAKAELENLYKEAYAVMIAGLKNGESHYDLVFPSEADYVVKNGTSLYSSITNGLTNEEGSRYVYSLIDEPSNYFLNKININSGSSFPEVEVEGPLGGYLYYTSTRSSSSETSYYLSFHFTKEDGNWVMSKWNIDTTKNVK